MQALLASQNVRAWAATVAGATSWLAVCSVVGKLGLLPPRLARKLTHIGEPICYLSWLDIDSALERACCRCPGQLVLVSDAVGGLDWYPWSRVDWFVNRHG